MTPKRSSTALSFGNDSPQLPWFKVERVMLDDERWLEVTCQRTGCGKMFMVRPGWKRKVPGLITRPCPYCFRVSKVPL
jgi:hypothetical protein